MSDDVKPCPWCGLDPEVIHGNMRRYARCANASDNGGLCGPAFHLEDRWNRRPVEDALRAKVEAAEAEAARLRAAIGEALRLASIYAGVAAHNAEAEPDTAGEAWRSPYMATMRELRQALVGAR